MFVIFNCVLKDSFYLYTLFARLYSVQFSSVQFSFISAPPHEQNNKMLRSLCVVKDGVILRKCHRVLCSSHFICPVKAYCRLLNQVTII